MAAAAALPVLGWMATSAHAALYPEHRSAELPALAPPVPHAVRIRVPDGSSLELAVFRPEGRAHARVLVLHGYSADRCQVLGVAAGLRDRGFETVVFELRGHGGRPGPYTFGLRELDDAGAVLAWGREQDGNTPRPAAAVGLSAGAALACQVAERHAEVRALVVDSISPRLRWAINRAIRLRYRFPPIPFGWLTWWALQLALRTPLARRDPLVLAPRMRQPVLVIAGGRDRRVDPAWARLLYERWGGPKDWWFDPAVGHVGQFAADPGRYCDRVAAFLSQALAPAAGGAGRDRR